MGLESLRLLTGQEVTLLGNPGEWFVVVGVDGDLLRLARRPGSMTGNFSIGIQAVRASRPPVLGADKGPIG